MRNSDKNLRSFRYKSSYVIITIFLLSAAFNQVKAQQIGDYVVLNSGDTLKGQIKQRSDLFRHLMHELVVLFDDSGKKIKVDKEELKSYKIGSDEYFVITTIRKKDTVELLAQRIISGPCELYEYWFVINHGPYGTSRPQQKFYLKRGHEPAHLYKYRDLMKGRDHYFADMPQLNFDIQQKKYNRFEIEKIVNTYNREYNK